MADVTHVLADISDAESDELFAMFRENVLWTEEISDEEAEAAVPEDDDDDE